MKRDVFKLNIILLIFLFSVGIYAQDCILIDPGHGGNTGLNVSWWNTQFIPYGLDAGSSGKALKEVPLASVASDSYSNFSKNELTLKIEIDSTDVVQGKQFTYSLIIENNGDKTRYIDKGGIHPTYYNVKTQEKITTLGAGFDEYYILNPKSKLEIPITQTFDYDLSYHNQKFTSRRTYWQPGQYKIVWNLSEATLHLKSNAIVINVIPIPEDKVKQFDYLVELANLRDESEMRKIIEKIEDFPDIQQSMYKEEIYNRLRGNLNRFNKENHSFIRKLEIEFFKLNPYTAMSVATYKRALLENERFPGLIDTLNNILKNNESIEKHKFEQILETQNLNFRKEGLDE